MQAYYLAEGQESKSDTSFLLSGIVAHELDSILIPNVHVINLSKGTGTVTSIEGSFALRVRNTDTVKFSCVGYRDRYLLVRQNILRKEILIFLKQDTILMDEVRISPLPPRRFFPIVFLNTRVAGEVAPGLELRIPGIKSIPGYEPTTGIIVGGPVQFLYNRFNKKERLSRKLKNNREKYAKYLVPEVGDSLIWPEK